jgi:hypothetical protein
VRQRLAAIANEIAGLKSAPVASADIHERIASDVRGEARAATPVISGVGAGQVLKIDWPPRVRGFETGPVSMACYLHEDLVVAKLTREVERLCSEPLPVEQRGARISELEQEREELWRVQSALVDRAVANGETELHDQSTPVPVILGVMVCQA